MSLILLSCVEKIKIRLSAIETAFNFEQLRGKHESLITSNSEEKIRVKGSKRQYFANFHFQLHVTFDTDYYLMSKF